MDILFELPPEIDHGAVALDMEMFHQDAERLHRPTGEFACISVCWDGNPEVVYQVFDVPDLRELLMHRVKKADTWVFHNAPYDLRQIRRWVNVKERPIWDTMLVEKNLYGGFFSTFSLKALVNRYLDTYLDKEAQEQFGEADVMTDDMKVYAAKDAYFTLKLYQMQSEKRDELESYFLIDGPATWAFMDMLPVKLNVKGWTELAVKYGALGKEIEEEIGLNVYSPPMVKEFLSKMGIKVRSTGAEVLEDYINEPIVQQILKARTYRKLESSYGMKWIENNTEAGDLIYPEWLVTTAETGRTSCRHPSLQNVPSREVPEYRKMFITNEGMFTVTDIQAQEPRILAQISQDKELLTIFREGRDVHTEVGRVAFRDPTMQKSDPRRDDAKTINLGTSYGMTARGLANKLNIPEEEAEIFLRNYFNRFSGVQNLITRMRSQAVRKGFVETLSHRIIWINQYNGQWENNAINGPIQGSGADFLKLWMVKLHTLTTKAKLPYPVCMTIHDELVLDHPKELAIPISQLLEESFQDTAQTLCPSVPFTREEFHGSTWACKKE